MPLERVESLGPRGAEGVQPIVESNELFRPQRVDASLGPALYVDEPTLVQDVQEFRDRRLGEAGDGDPDAVGPGVGDAVGLCGSVTDPMPVLPAWSLNGLSARILAKSAFQSNDRVTSTPAPASPLVGESGPCL
jgi:hypothetical protein